MDSSDNAAAAEQAVFIFLKCSDDENSARESCYRLEGKLAEEVCKSNSGEYDGYDLGQGQCIFYLYGQSARHLYDSISGVIAQFGPPPQSFVRIRYGGPGAPEELIEFKNPAASRWPSQRPAPLARRHNAHTA
jgi:hypothetical protein